jgi:hypothetical protein
VTTIAPDPARATTRRRDVVERDMTNSWIPDDGEPGT